MKKVLSLILALSFILTASCVLAVSAADTTLNEANKGWYVPRSAGTIRTDGNQEFYFNAGADGSTWEWPVIHDGELEEGTITAVLGPKGGAGIFFGATGIRANVKEGSENSLKAADKDIRFYWASLVYEGSTLKFKFYADQSQTGQYRQIGATVNLSSAHGCDGVSDVELKVSFSKEGACTVYVNGKSVYSASGLSLFGNEYGMIVNYAKNLTPSARAGYVKSFTTAEVSSYINWAPRRGATAYAPVDNGEFLWKYQGTNVWNNPIRYNTDLEKGTVIATVAKGSKIGVLFGATGLNNVKDGTDANISVSNAPSLRYFWAYVKDNTLTLEADKNADAGNQGRETVASATLPVSSADADYTIKVIFNKSGDISVSFNDAEYIKITAAELKTKGFEIYGSEVGMMPVALSNGTANAVAGSVKAFSLSQEHPGLPEDPVEAPDDTTPPAETPDGGTDGGDTPDGGSDNTETGNTDTADEGKKDANDGKNAGLVWIIAGVLAIVVIGAVAIVVIKKKKK